MSNPDLITALRSILHRKKSNEYFANVLNCTVEEVEWARAELKKQGVTAYSLSQEPEQEDGFLEPDTKSCYSEDLQNGTAEITREFAYEIHNLEELIQKCSIDTERWEVIKYVQNYWGNSDDPHWQVKAWLERKKKDKADVLSEVLQNYQPHFTAYTPEQLRLNTVYDHPCLVYIALTDVHIDKYESSHSTIQQKLDKYLRVLKTLVLRCYGTCYVDEILYVIGHDWFNSDTYHVTTTNGTQQFNNSEWDQAYDLGFDCQVQAIAFLKQFCNHLVVKYVPGNHDRTKSYYMVHALEREFSGDRNIVFDRSAESTKCHTYGQTFIGMHHGDTKIENLPLYCANKFYQQWGQCRYHEIGVGDKHHRKQFRLDVEDNEISGVRLFMTPSLGGDGKWDRQMLYDNSIQAGIVRIYDYENGKCGEFEERI